MSYIYTNLLVPSFWDETIEQTFVDRNGAGQFRLICGLSPTLWARGLLKKHLELVESLDHSFLEDATEEVVLIFRGHRAVPMYLMGQPQRAWEEVSGSVAAIKQPAFESSHMVGGSIYFFTAFAYGTRSLLLLGQFDQARELLNRAVALARLTEHPPSLCWALGTVGEHMIYQEDIAGLKAAVDEYEPIAGSLGLRTREALAGLHRGALQILSGDIELGIKISWDGLKACEHAQGLFHCSERASNIANLLTNNGRLDLISPFLDYAEQIQARSDERIGRSELIRLRARIAQSKGQPGARALFEQALEHATNSGELLFTIRACCDLIEVTDCLQQRADSVATLQKLFAQTSGGKDIGDMVRARSLLDAG